MTNSHPKFIEAVFKASNSAPTFLSRHETIGVVDSISAAFSSRKLTSSALLDLILPYGMYPIFGNTRYEMQLTNDLCSLILFRDKMNNDVDLSFLNGMLFFN